MTKLFFRIFLVVLPTLAVLGYLEYRLSLLDTHYLAKRTFLEEQERDIKILTLGSSNAYFGINPAKFSCTGYNLAINAQSMYYDWKLLDKYVDKLPNLKLVVLPAIFYTAGTDLASTSQNWREFFYKQYFGLSLEAPNGKMFSLMQSLDARNFTKIALYGDTLYDHIATKFLRHVDYVVGRTGWHDSSDADKANLLLKVGPRAAEVHSAEFNLTNLHRNIAYWEKIVERLKQRNIQILVLMLPEDRSYYSNLDPVKFAAFRNAFKDFAVNNHLLYRDYTEDPRFDLEDMTFMVDHMNPEGANKFGEIFNRDFIFDACQ